MRPFTDGKPRSTTNGAICPKKGAGEYWQNGRSIGRIGQMEQENNMAEQQMLHAGQIVRLKSGGPEMTVHSETPVDGQTRYRCQWFAGKKLELGLFPRESLELVESGE